MQRGSLVLGTLGDRIMRLNFLCYVINFIKIYYKAHGAQWIAVFNFKLLWQLYRIILHKYYRSIYTFVTVLQCYNLIFLCIEDSNSYAYKMITI